MIKAAIIILNHSTGIVSELTEEWFSRYASKENLWEDAQKKLDEWAQNVSMGYDDVDFKIIFQDGFVYSARLEIYKRLKNTKLKDHIKSHLLHYSGRKTVKGQTEEEKEKFLQVFSPEPGRSELCRILDTYDLEN